MGCIRTECLLVCFSKIFLSLCVYGRVLCLKTTTATAKQKKPMKQSVLCFSFFLFFVCSFMFLQFHITGTIRVLCIRDAPPVYCHLCIYSYASAYHIHVWYSEMWLTAELAGCCISWRGHYWYAAKSLGEIALTVSPRRRPDFFGGTYLTSLVARSLGEVVEAQCWLSSQFIRHNQAVSRCLLWVFQTCRQWRKKLPPLRIKRSFAVQLERRRVCGTRLITAIRSRLHHNRQISKHGA